MNSTFKTTDKDNIMASEMSSSEIDPKPTTIGNKYSSSFIVKHLPHDLKVQILFQAPDMCTMLALTTAYPEFMKAFEDAPRAIMTKVVIRQLGLNGFNVNHPLLDLLHHLGYPSTLDWNNDKAFTSGLKALHEVILGHREVMNLDECFTLLGEGYDAYYFLWLIKRIRDLLDQAAVS